MLQLVNKKNFDVQNESNITICKQESNHNDLFASYCYVLVLVQCHSAVLHHFWRLRPDVHIFGHTHFGGVANKVRNW